MDLNIDSFFPKTKNEDIILNKDIQIKNLKIELNNRENIIKELNQKIQYKIYEINNLKNQINNINNNDLVTQINPGEKVISALFHSSDLKIDFSIACKNTTPFVKLEEKLYEEYPDYKETDNYFLQNGNKIKRFKTMEENNINSGKPIIIFSDNN